MHLIRRSLIDRNSHAVAERCRKLPAPILSGRRLLSAAEAERFRNDCLRTCAEPLVLDDQNPYSLKRHASNRVKPYLLFPWAAELVRHPRVLDLVEAVIGPDILVFHTTVWMKAAHSENYDRRSRWFLRIIKLH
jgi:hypothetical protein